MRVTMFAPQREKCGIRDYSDLLITGLKEQPEIEGVDVVPVPVEANRGGVVQAVRNYAAEEQRFRSSGKAMNAGDVAHLQHQYFFFGGVGPHKNHARAFYGAIRVPLVVTVHEIAMAETGASLLLRQTLGMANRQNFLHPAIGRYIVHTELDAERLREIGVSARKIQRVVHGVPAAAPMPDVQEAKRVLGLEGKRVVTLFGFLAVKKGHRIALQALAELPPDVTLLFAGDRHPDDTTDYVPNLRAEIGARGLTERVRITGYLPAGEIPTLMAATEVGIAPFLQSSGSGSLANLFAYGRAVVASDIVPHQEMARESPAPLRLFRSGAAADLAAALHALLDSEAERTALQQSALAYAARHAYAEMARETAEVYRSLLAGR